MEHILTVQFYVSILYIYIDFQITPRRFLCEKINEYLRTGARLEGVYEFREYRIMERTMKVSERMICLKDGRFRGGCFEIVPVRNCDFNIGTFMFHLTCKLWK